MKPLHRAVVPASEDIPIVIDVMNKWRAGDPAIRTALSEIVASDDFTIVQAAFENHVKEHREKDEVWMNDIYQVSVRRYVSPFGHVRHLSIKRRDRKPVIDWRDKQEIKNQLCGPECEGVELYPAESRLVDTANQFHLWVVMKEGFRFPFGFESRVVTDDTIGKSQQRKR